MTASNYTEAWRLEWIRGTAAPSAPATLYLGASTADPGEDGAGLSEPSSGDGYARIAVTFNAPAGRSMATDADQLFAAATNAWPTVTHWCFFDAPTGGNLLHSVAMSSGQTVGAGAQLRYPSGSTISHTGNVSEYLSHAWLNWYRGTDMPAAPAAVYGGLSTSTPAADGTNVTEPSGNGYAREAMAFDAAVQGGDSATIANSDAETWGPATPAGWGTVTHGVIYDALTTGNLLFWGALSQGSQTVNADDDVAVAAGEITLAAA